MNSKPSRRAFIKALGTTAAISALGPTVFADDQAENKSVELKIHRRQFIGPNDNVNIALIGAGGMGTQDTQVALQVPGIKLVAVCDLYQGRLDNAKKNGEARFILPDFTRTSSTAPISMPLL